MRWLLLIGIVTFFGCAKEKTYIPPAPTYFLVLPDKPTIWVEHVEKGFLAGCEQLQMECAVKKYGDLAPPALAEFVVAMGDPRKAAITIAFESPEKIKETLDLLSLKDRSAITIGTDDSTAYRLGHVGADAKKLASLLAIRSQSMDPPAKRILLLFGSAPINREMLEASVFRESNKWETFRPRSKTVTEVTEEDFSWCDLVVPIGEDALDKAIASKGTRIIPTDPSQKTLDLLDAERVPTVITNNYFDIGLRASRIAREKFVYGQIQTPILAIQPKEVDRESMQYYLDTRFRVPAITPSKPPPPVSNPDK
ncbi:MAG: hypothetical protein ABIV13_05335 [Fimbriimonadales bacterium]